VNNVESFTTYMKRRGLPSHFMPQAKQALQLAKSRAFTKVVKTEVDGDDVALIDSDGDEVTYDDLIRAYRIDEYVDSTGDGPEMLKDLLRF
jgi:protoporphyrinogen oxidase